MVRINAFFKSKLIKSMLIFILVLAVWIILAPGCMTFREADATAIKNFNKQGITLRVNKLTIGEKTLHYVETGNASLPTIVFVHGTPGSWNAFENYLKDTDLLKRFRLISIDRPGFGYSDFGNPLNLLQQSVIITPLFSHIKNGQPVYLVGHSLGGPMICRLAVDNPTLFAGLIILAGSLDPAAENPEKWRPILFKTSLQYLIPGALRPSNVELWYLKKDLADLKPLLPQITCQVYILHGTKDMLVPFSNVAYMNKMFTHVANKETIVFDKENHFIPWTKFKEIKGLLLRL